MMQEMLAFHVGNPSGMETNRHNIVLSPRESVKTAGKDFGYLVRLCQQLAISIYAYEMAFCL